jgi:hypothetical protein
MANGIFRSRPWITRSCGQLPLGLLPKLQGIPVNSRSPGRGRFSETLQRGWTLVAVSIEEDVFYKRHYHENDNKGANRVPHPIPHIQPLCISFFYH